MKLENPLWFKILLLLILIVYIVTITPFIVSTKSITHYLGMYGLLLFICYFLIITAIILMLVRDKRGYYLFLFSQAMIPIIYLIEGSYFSIEKAIFTPVIYCGLVILGVNSKKQSQN